MLLQTLKISFKKFYEHLFKLVIVGIIWFFITSILIFTGYSGFISGWVLMPIISLILIGPFQLSALQVVNNLVKREEVGVKSFFTGFIRYFKRGLFGFLLSLVIYLVLAVDLFFFLNRSQGSNLYLIISVFWLYLILFFSMIQFYFWGLLTIQGDEKILTLLKRSFLLALDNAFFAFLMVVIIILLLALFFVTGVALPLLTLGVIGMIIINGTKLTLEKYD
ncbi:DUF624 domain-containing protein [Halothermothrix orenii]|uniref:Uncharacterized protein n=1 Tax=Halothermothrix orenii (strain H 168 / OCM 544 / DSM 9562) TaxID=373903 RepID=B8CYI6_HALOH|nr:DUF624 domain-containing protein [Halothermothrix orenii]ACL70355.1 hypothetical protein Hore_16060 [Halothermothrix orenii H 168]